MGVEMSKLQEAAMARVPLSPEEVEKHWRSHGLVIEVLCESHERLRMERDAAVTLLEAKREQLARVGEIYDAAVYGGPVHNALDDVVHEIRGWC